MSFSICYPFISGTFIDYFYSKVVGFFSPIWFINGNKSFIGYLLIQSFYFYIKILKLSFRIYLFYSFLQHCLFHSKTFFKKCFATLPPIFVSAKRHTYTNQEYFYFKKQMKQWTLPLFIPHLFWLTNVIMKKQYYKTCQIKKKKKKTKQQKITRIQYNKYYLICTSIIVYYNYCYRQKAKKLKTAAEETMACAKYSPQVHKLRTLRCGQSLVRQKSTAFIGKSRSHEDRWQIYKLWEGMRDKIFSKS